MKLKSIWVSAQMYIYKNTILIQFKYHGILNMVQYNRIYIKHCAKKIWDLTNKMFQMFYFNRTVKHNVFNINIDCKKM